ncbi:twin transmembrane helix small protein [Ideonella sp.]|uniref:twin transmembrane helix small protein n=1 Tax=Ideonella sp. TaxID=1929293 RepID=UPI003BB6CDAC
MKIIIVLALLAIVAALAGAGLFMLKRPGDQEGARPARMARALALRVGLSVSLFLFVLLAYLLGWIEPRGVPLG